MKSVRKLAGGFGYQFFLSDNEYSVSKEIEHQDSYFFYLVFFGSNMEPIRLETHFAKDFYKKCDMSAASYRVIFDLVEK